MHARENYYFFFSTSTTTATATTTTTTCYYYYDYYYYCCCCYYYYYYNNYNNYYYYYYYYYTKTVVNNKAHRSEASCSASSLAPSHTSFSMPSLKLLGSASIFCSSPSRAAAPCRHRVVCWTRLTRNSTAAVMCMMQSTWPSVRNGLQYLLLFVQSKKRTTHLLLSHGRPTVVLLSTALQ